jgi:ubiquinone/menaquinone biosynthesis C-methylase UbiE
LPKRAQTTTGVDLNEAAVELAQKRFEISGLPASFKQQMQKNLEFADESFDLVYSHGVLHHTPDTARAVREIHRVLRPRVAAQSLCFIIATPITFE